MITPRPAAGPSRPDRRTDRRTVAGPDAALGVVIVNFRGADDTIECLESLMRSTVALRIVVVENGSGDDSAQKLRDWAAGRYRPAPASDTMAVFTVPPLPKPVTMVEMPASAVSDAPGAVAPLTLILSDDNLGFAGGNNLGLRLLTSDRRLRHFWLLNNDTVVAPDAPAALLRRMDATPDIGMCGTVVCHYWQPDRLQALNGYVFNKYTGAGRAIGGEELAAIAYSPQDVADATDFVLGASLAVSRPFLSEVGPMAEDYFLYFEEIDWAVRNRRRGTNAFVTGFAHGANVYHKAGRAIGSRSLTAARSAFSEYWLARSRLRFTARFFPWLWPLHWLLCWAMLGRRLIRRQFANAGALARAALGRPFR